MGVQQLTFSLKKFYLEVTRLHSLLLRRPLTPFFDMKTATTSSDTKASGYEDRRTFAQVVVADIVDYLYFFMPLVIIHNVGWLLKPLLTDDTRGPWEIIWHQYCDFSILLDICHDVFAHGLHSTTSLSDE